MRFKLKDISKANTEELKKQKWVKGVLVVGGEYQVVIGTKVETFYKVFLKVKYFKERTNKILFDEYGYIPQIKQKMNDKKW